MSSCHHYVKISRDQVFVTDMSRKIHIDSFYFSGQCCLKRLYHGRRSMPIASGARPLVRWSGKLIDGYTYTGSCTMTVGSLRQSGVESIISTESSSGLGLSDASCPRSCTYPPSSASVDSNAARRSSPWPARGFPSDLVQ